MRYNFNCQDIDMLQTKDAGPIIVNYLSDIKDGENIPMDINLLQEKIIDSFQLIRLIGFLEEEYNIEFKTEDLIPENFTTVTAIAHLVKRTRKKQESE